MACDYGCIMADAGRSTKEGGELLWSPIIWTAESLISCIYDTNGLTRKVRRKSIAKYT